MFFIPTYISVLIISVQQKLKECVFGEGVGMVVVGSWRSQCLV